jgi:hypothetical protein
MMTRKTVLTISRFPSAVGLALLAVVGLSLPGTAARGASQPTIVTLTQVGCQFVESENGVDHMFKTAKSADCKAINAKTGQARLAKAKVLRLKPGRYIFRVTNKNVPYGLGFWLRGKGLGRGDPGIQDHLETRRILLFVPAQPDAGLSARRRGVNASGSWCQHGHARSLAAMISSRNVPHSAI